MISEADLKKFAPKMHPDYKAAFLNHQEILAEAGIFENEYRKAHFMGQFGAETDGGRIIRESLTYTTAKRLRQVWPSRFRDKSDAALRPLIKNPVALGDSVYGGRMGNGKTNGDGYKYRGGGMLQTTGKSAVLKYAGACQMDCGDQHLETYLDDCAATLRFACLEWKQSKCNQWADENSLLKVSKAINTGSATSGIQPVGMDNRKAWFAKAWGVWGDKGKPDTRSKPSVMAGMMKLGAPPAAAAVALQTGAEHSETVTAALPSLDTVVSAKTWADTAADLSGWAMSNMAIAASVGAIAVGFIWGPTYWPRARAWLALKLATEA